MEKGGNHGESVQIFSGALSSSFIADRGSPNSRVENIAKYFVLNGHTFRMEGRADTGYIATYNMYQTRNIAGDV